MVADISGGCSRVLAGDSLFQGVHAVHVHLEPEDRTGERDADPPGPRRSPSRRVRLPGRCKACTTAVFGLCDPAETPSPL